MTALLKSLKARLVFALGGWLLIWMVQRRRPQKLNADGTRPASAPIRALLDFDVNTTKPYPYRPWSSGKFAMTMGIQKVALEDWLQLDNCYVKEQAFRRELLANKPSIQ